ncbi:MAG TPA: OadG family transporter subunit [Bacillota bacterium]|nr:OadG family transporter subunit [Bacillota bacterium]
MFGETVSFAESLQVTVLGMGVVFVVLVLLMCIIKIMEKVMYRGGQKDDAPIKATAPEPPAAAPKPAAAPEPASADAGSDMELVAVIAAAAAASMGVSPSDLVIRRIVRLPETAPVWSLSGRAELMASRNMKH